MKRVLGLGLATMLLVSAGCGADEPGGGVGIGGSCTSTADCADGLECVGGICTDPNAMMVDAGPEDPDSGDGEGTDSGNTEGMDSGVELPPGTPCTVDEACPDGQLCLGNRCQDAPCADEPDFCTEGQCFARCVAVVDPCSTIECGDQETCIDGVCFAGCFPPLPCTGVTCDDGSFCDPSLGRCVAVDNCNGWCPDGFTCDLTCVVAGRCDDVACPDGHRCIAGRCVEDLCAGVTCDSDTAVCVNGRCQDTCTCRPNCPLGSRCELGVCVCEADCTAAACGEPDGCGGTCNGPCPVGQQCEVSDDRYICVCEPDCSGRNCGDPNGCGFPCQGPCPDSTQVCYDGDCCVPDCAEATTCGEPDGCGGTCFGPCPGDQDQCVPDAGLYECECIPDCPPTATCGDPDGCNGTCNGTCPTDEFCADTRDGYECRCQPNCPPTAVCGDDDSCGGFCDVPCGGGDVCGPSGCCTPSCPAGAACGADDGCGGTCTGDCTDPDEQCVERGGDYQCRCTPDCAGAVCGAPDGCGGQCNNGGCGTGEFCDTGVCRPDPCTPSCGCGEVCISGRCANLCGAGETLCGCNNCCGPAETCIAGTCIAGPG